MGRLSLCYVADICPPAGVLRAVSPQHLLYTAVSCTMGLGSLVLCVKYEPPSLSKGCHLCGGGSGAGILVMGVLRRASFPPWCSVCPGELRQPPDSFLGRMMSRCYPPSFPPGFWVGEGEATGANVNRDGLSPHHPGLWPWVWFKNRLVLCSHGQDGTRAVGGWAAGCLFPQCPQAAGWGWLRLQGRGPAGCPEKLPTQRAGFIYFCKERSI